MALPTLLLLPGLDGTGRLFEPLCEALWDQHPGVHVVPLGLPDLHLDYDGLCRWLVEERLPPGPLVVVGESFSGPLALAVARARPRRVVGVVLVATFVQPPVPGAGMLAGLVGGWAFWSGWLGVAVRYLLVGPGASEGQVAAALDAVRSVSPATLAHRLRQTLAADVSEHFAQLDCPLLYLHATRDRLLGGRAVRTVRRLRPDVPVLELDAPHLVLQALPHEAAAIILAFARDARRADHRGGGTGGAALDPTTGSPDPEDPTAQ